MLSLKDHCIINFFNSSHLRRKLYQSRRLAEYYDHFVMDRIYFRFQVSSVNTLKTLF